uniref:Peptidase C39 domain-containing protein n=2 Tax=Bursaphelenchus xylophilus TaxID=6326 RepID=A0A1I7RUC2_BURXY
MWREQCLWGPQVSYNHNSTAFTLTNKFWERKDAAGFWATDEMHIRFNGSSQKLGIAAIALRTMYHVRSEESRFGTIGLSRDPHLKTFVTLLKESGLIDYRVLTIDYSPEWYAYFHFGIHSADGCDRHVKTVTALGGSVWMFDAKGVALLDYQSTHNFRIMLTEGFSSWIPRTLLLQFIQSGALALNQDFGMNNFYTLNLSHDFFNHHFEYKVERRLQTFA